MAYACGALIPESQNTCTRDAGHGGEHRCSAGDVDARAARTTRGIAPAQTGALAVLQHTVHHRAGEAGFEDDAEVRIAAREIASYHAPSEDQIDRLGSMTAALEDFLVQLVRLCPPGPERSTAISRAREAKMWASSAIALEGR